MAKNVLPVDFQDDILAESMNGRRKYQMITNSDGTVSFVDVTEYKQVGSNFGQAQVNATNEAVNESADKNKIIDDKDDLVANSQAGMMAGALAVKAIREELTQKMEWKFMGSGNAIQIPAGAKDINVCVTFEPGQVASSVIPNRNQRVDFGFYYTPSANGSACVNIANSVLTLVQAFNGGEDARTTVHMNAYYR